jgi:hypothetical protein
MVALCWIKRPFATNLKEWRRIRRDVNKLCTSSKIRILGEFGFVVMLVRYRTIEQKKDSQTGELRGGMQKLSLRLIGRSIRFRRVNNFWESAASPGDNWQ